MFDLRSAHKPGLICAALFIVVGVVSFVEAGSIQIYHPTMRRSDRHSSEHVSKSRGQFYAGCVTVFGLAIGAISLYRPRQ
jgi:hypothetical protein